MNKKTLEALKASIAKWERNAKAKRSSEFIIGPKDCALCQIFQVGLSHCDGCPVKEKTGRPFCIDTPYPDAARAWDAWHMGIDARDAAISAAREEVAFLKSLLPTDHP